jgi:SAM-dependent methyltransferase
MSMFARLKRGAIRKLVQDPAGMGRPVPKEIFDEGFRSGHWDLLNLKEELPRYAVLAALIAEAFEHPAVLDVGCGNGRLVGFLEKEGMDRYVGLDLSSEGIELARRRAPETAQFVVGNFEDWRPLEKFDAIVFNESIGYARDPAATLGAYAQSLTDGRGLFFVSYFRSGNYRALWRRMGGVCQTVFATSVVADTGKAWDIRVLCPAGRTAA